MTTETMNVHKALSERKMLEKRLSSDISTGIYCVANRHSNQKIAGVSIEEFKQQMQGDYDKVVNEIIRYNALNKAIILSNAQTIVEINGEKYTVAEAIAMKNHGMTYNTELLKELQRQYRKEKLIIKEVEDSIGVKADKYIVDMYGNSEKNQKNEYVTQAREEYVKQNSYDFVDVIGILDKITDLFKNIDSFMSEVDAVLSTSNAVTMITFTY